MFINLAFPSITRSVERRNFEVVPNGTCMALRHNYRDNSKARTGSLETLFCSDVLFVKWLTQLEGIFGK